MATLPQMKRALVEADRKAENAKTRAEREKAEKDAQQLASAIRKRQSQSDKSKELEKSDEGFIESVVSLATGEGRGRGRYPELTEADVGLSEATQIGTGFLTTPSPEARKDIVKKALPGTEFKTDEDGNTVVVLPDGQKAYMNEPGFSTQDFLDFSADVIKFAPAAKWASGGKTLLTKAMKGITGAAGTSAAEDVAAVPQGSKQPIDIGKMGVSAAGGAAGEAAAPILGGISRVLKRTFGSRTGQVFDVGGDFTPKARKALQKAGFDPDEISPDLARSAIEASEKGARPGATGGVAESERFGIPFTRGQATRSFKQQADEEALRARGDEAGDIIRQFDERQQERVVEVTNEIEEYLGKRPKLKEEVEAGGRVSEEVQAQSDELLVTIDDAFEEASRMNATLNREGLDRLKQASQVVKEEGIPADRDLTPATRKALRQINKLAGKRQTDTGLVTAKGEPIKRDAITKRTIEEIEKTRKKLTQLQGSAKNRTDLKGVTLLKKRFDEYLENAVDNALYSGDEEALEALKNARNLRAEYGRRFQEQTRRSRSGRKIKDPGGQVVEKIVEDNPTNEQVVNMIFGRSKLFGNKDASQVIDSLRNSTKNADIINDTLKQITWRRIVEPSIDDGKFSPEKFRTSFNKTMKEHPELMRKIFSEEDIQTLREFKTMTNRLRTPKAAQNPSGTAGMIRRNLQSIGMVLGLQKGGIGFGAVGSRFGAGAGRMIERKIAKGEAEDAINPQLLLSGRPNSTTVSSVVAGTREGLSGEEEQ